SAVCVTPDGNVIANIAEDKVETASDRMYLNHYFARSFEEFALKKSRGRPSSSEHGQNYNMDNFTWGSGVNLEKFMPSAIYQHETQDRLSKLLADDGIAKASASAMQMAKTSLEKLRKEMNLPVEYERITGSKPSN
ncbi:MAG: hypothetical protein ABL907_02025, partial [Hyphomicrobium sp.]